MEFNISSFSSEKVNIENKMRGLEITPLNFKMYEFNLINKIDSLLMTYTPVYCKWENKKELKERFETLLMSKLEEVERLKMLIKICSRKKYFLVEKDK